MRQFQNSVVMQFLWRRIFAPKNLTEQYGKNTLPSLELLAQEWHLFFFLKRYTSVQTTFNTGKRSERIIAVVVSGLIADRFMSFFLKLVSRLVLNLTAKNGMTVPLAELRIALLRKKHLAASPERPPPASPQQAGHHYLHAAVSSDGNLQQSCLDQATSHPPPNQPAGTAAPSHRT